MEKTTTGFRVPVHCSDEYFDDHPENVSIKLTRDDAAHILFLSQEVKRLGVYKIVEWDGTPNWTGSKEYRVECETLNVNDTDFHYDCIPKHTSVILETEGIYIKDLKKRFPGLQAKKREVTE